MILKGLGDSSTTSLSGTSLVAAASFQSLQAGDLILLRAMALLLDPVGLGSPSQARDHLGQDVRNTEPTLPTWARLHLVIWDGEATWISRVPQ